MQMIFSGRSIGSTAADPIGHVRGTVPVTKVWQVARDPYRRCPGRANVVVMPRIARSQLLEFGGACHVTHRGTGGTYVFLDDDDRERFRLLLRRVTSMFEWELHAWCLMGPHFHLLVQASRENLSAGMHRLAGLYAQGFNARWERK